MFLLHQDSVGIPFVLLVTAPRVSFDNKKSKQVSTSISVSRVLPSSSLNTVTLPSTFECGEVFPSLGKRETVAI
jgi:hypothetical protein